MRLRRPHFLVLVFGVIHGLVTFLAWRVGLVGVDLHASWPKIVFDIVLLLAWNEVHFYCLHRLLHTRVGSIATFTGFIMSRWRPRRFPLTASSLA